jgi:hypothetical protein
MKIEIEIDETMAPQTQLIIRVSDKQYQSHINPAWAATTVRDLVKTYKAQ